MQPQKRKGGNAVNFSDELKEAFRQLAEFVSNTMSPAEEFCEMADLCVIPEAQKEKRNPGERLLSAQPARCHHNHCERWHTAATGE